MSFNLTSIFQGADKPSFYGDLYRQAKVLFEKEDDMLANLGNLSALLFFNLKSVNWAGFYLLKDGELVLGPFNGKVACTRIQLDKGVCGAAAREEKTQIVADVHQFPGHIACDSASNSEIVIPFYVNGELFGVLDIDSPDKNTFTSEDEVGLKALLKLLEEKTKFI